MAGAHGDATSIDYIQQMWDLPHLASMLQQHRTAPVELKLTMLLLHLRHSRASAAHEVAVEHEEQPASVLLLSEEVARLHGVLARAEDTVSDTTAACRD